MAKFKILTADSEASYAVDFDETETLESAKKKGKTTKIGKHFLTPSKSRRKTRKRWKTVEFDLHGPIFNKRRKCPRSDSFNPFPRTRWNSSCFGKSRTSFNSVEC